MTRPDRLLFLVGCLGLFGPFLAHGEPPVAESVCEYGAPTVPAAKVPAVMDKPLAGVISTKKALLAPLDLG